jgi:hypothetical protein
VKLIQLLWAAEQPTEVSLTSMGHKATNGSLDNPIHRAARAALCLVKISKIASAAAPPSTTPPLLLLCCRHPWEARAPPSSSSSLQPPHLTTPYLGRLPCAAPERRPSSCQGRSSSCQGRSSSCSGVGGSSVAPSSSEQSPPSSSSLHVYEYETMWMTFIRVCVYLSYISTMCVNVYLR